METFFKWEIKNFSKTAARDDPRAFLASKRFNLGPSHVKCSLKFYPTNTRPVESKTFSSLFLCISDFSDEESLTIAYRLWAENSAGERVGVREKELFHTFRPNDVTGWGYSEFLPYDDLYSPQSIFANGDTVYFCCEVRRKLAPNEIFVPVEVQLREKIWSLHKQGFNGNCTIAAGDKPFLIEKTLLMAQSETFDQILTNDTNEAQTSTIKIENVRPEIVDALIEFLYLRKVYDLEAVAEELYHVARNYAIKELETKCLKVLERSLTDANFATRLVTAFKNNDAELKQQVLNHVANGNFDANFKHIITSDAWANLVLSNKSLADEILAAVFARAPWHTTE